MRLAQIGEVFRIFPVAGIEHVISTLRETFEFERDVNCLAVTYNYSPDIIGKLQRIAPNIRVFCGKATKIEMVRGALVSPAHTHFKGIMMWTFTKLVYYIGSSNLTNETGGNYGIIVIKDSGFDYFDVNYSGVNDYVIGDPFFIIFNEIVFKETRGVCEYTGKQFERLRLVKGKFEGVLG
ncbi:hypothetical protein DRO97_08130 [Archaeoglobales archaeon]|nr:MAG: hypothetical protein DRO97_08130 [Archaeoglobales archaeon]